MLRSTFHQWVLHTTEILPHNFLSSALSPTLKRPKHVKKRPYSYCKTNVSHIKLVNSINASKRSVIPYKFPHTKLSCFFYTLICSTSKIGCKPQSSLTLRLMSCPITGTKSHVGLSPVTCEGWKRNNSHTCTQTHKDGGRRPASSLIVSGTERKAVRTSPVFLGQSDVRMEVFLDKMVVTKIV